MIKDNPEFAALRALRIDARIQAMHLTDDQLMDICHVAVQGLKFADMIRVPCSGTCEDMKVEPIDWDSITPEHFGEI